MKENILPPQTAYRRRLSDMLDLTYELEGLLHIGVTRSEVPQRLNQLIVAKLNAIIELADEPASPEELAPAQYMEPSSEVEPEHYDEPEPEIEVTPMIEAEPESYTDPEPEPYIEPEPESYIEPETYKRPDTEPFIDPEPEVEEKPVPERGRLFSINDRFLYARELFGGDVRNFDRAINDVITFDSYDEAEEYFVSEWGMDPESPRAIKFLGTINQLFHG